MKKSILIGLLSAVFLSGCGRPDNYKEKAEINFNALYAALANTYNLGVMVVAVKGTAPYERRRSWVGNAHTKNPNEDFPPGLWSFYGIGFHSTSGGATWSSGSIELKCAKVNKNLQSSQNDITLNFGICGSDNEEYLEQGASNLKAAAQACASSNAPNFRC